MRSLNIAEGTPAPLAQPVVQPLAVSMGDPAGIGPEILAKAWAAREQQGLPTFFAVGDARAVAAVWDGPIVSIGDPAEAAGVFVRGLPVLGVDDGGQISPGHPDVDGARCALHSLEVAAGLARSDAASALVTGPVSKAQLYQIGFTYPGQTEFVAERCGVSRDNAVMMLAGPTLRVVPVTTHVALNLVAGLLSIDLIVAKGRATARGLYRNFGIENPRLAFAGFNPHAGEGGAIGREEIDFIIPAIAQLRDEGIEATGPFAADTMFHARARSTYDAAICCYHDQALVPLKTLHFDEGVNITLGLPIVRTSPDHGTAFGIAGKNIAHPGAMIAAIRMAGEATERRAALGL
jgi:4-hydroxythreonine-4-phosphate dehydrogenase